MGKRTPFCVYEFVYKDSSKRVMGKRCHCFYSIGYKDYSRKSMSCVRKVFAARSYPIKSQARGTAYVSSVSVV